MIPHGKDGKRRYGCWAGEPAGKPEDMDRCIEAVRPQGRYISVQCSRKRGHGFLGNFCKQHAKYYPAISSPDRTTNTEQERQ